MIVLTAAEEGGCIGSRHLAQTQLLGKAGAMVVGEPTSNYPLVGHKGSVKFHAAFKGVGAHGSMPELGVNAIYKAAKALGKLENFNFDVSPHKIMGKPTLNVGTIEGGNTVNAVPDSARIGVDIRTVPGMNHDELLSRLKKLHWRSRDRCFLQPAAGVDRAGRRLDAARVRDLQAATSARRRRRAPRRT